MKTKHDELILLLQTLLEKAEFLGHSTNALEYGVCYDQVRPVIKRIENYLFAHPEIPFSDENRNLLSPNQAYDKFPVSLKNAAFLLQRAVISREDDNSGKADEDGAENGQNYSVFLLDIAGQVNSLIEQNRDRFIQQVKEFEDRFYHWQVEFRKAYQNAKDKPYLRYNENEHKSRNIPAEYIFYDINKEVYYDADEDGRFHFWGPKISFNPIDTLRKRHLFDIVFPSKDGEIIARKPSDTVEDLLRKYYLLAVIHAYKGDGFSVLENIDIKSLDDSDNEPACYVWQAYEDSVAGIKDEGRKRNLIETALNSVRRDIETILIEKNHPTDGGGEKSPELNDTEREIITALGEKSLKGEALTKKAKLPYNSNTKATLSSLVKREILGNTKNKGYFLKPEYHFLLSQKQGQD